MEAMFVKAFEYLIQRSDPMLVVCVLMLGIWQHRNGKTLNKHLNPDPQENPYPHPQCLNHQQTYTSLAKAIDENHRETCRSIDDLSNRIDTVLEIAIKNK